MKLTRLSIAEWFCLIAGIAIITLQIVKYFKGTLELTISEVIVTIVAGLLMFAPRALAQAGRKILHKKSQ